MFTPQPVPGRSTPPVRDLAAIAAQSFVKAFSARLGHRLADLLVALLLITVFLLSC